MSEHTPPSLSPSLPEAVSRVMGGTARQLTRVGAGAHVCLLHESFEEQIAAFVPFLRMGLERGECCVYLLDMHVPEEVGQALREQGVDVERELARGALVLTAAREVYLRWEPFMPERTVAVLARMDVEARAAGFTGLRVCGESTWMLGSKVDAEQFIRFEMMLNRFYPGSHSAGLCQFNRQRFSPQFLHDVLRTHPVTIVEDEVHDNLFYEPPELVLGEGSARQRLEWMVAQLKRERETQRKLVQLGLRLAEQAEENARLYEEARAAVRLRDEFLSVASHELKTPLTPLRLRLQGLRREVESDATGPTWRERVVHAARGAEQQLHKLTTLVDALLDVSRLTQGRLALTWVELDVTEVVREVAERFAQQAAKVGCELEVVAEGPVVGRWDRLRLEQVMTNLLTNALKYGAGRPVRVAVEGTPEVAVLVVRDEGIGIEPEHLERIFGKFERAVSGRHYGGLGLGLYITRQIVQALGGSIEVESAPGQGATFRVTLPRWRAVDAG